MNNNMTNFPQQSNFPQMHVQPEIDHLRITRLLIQRAGSYQQMYYRPYQTHINADTSDALMRRLESNNGAKTTSGLLAGLAGQIMTPTHQPMGNIVIPNGWNELRGRFLMKVEVTYAHQQVHLFIIQGYTDYFDTSISGAFDPDITFYINSYVRFTRNVRVTANGLETIDIPNESAQVINGRLIHTQAQQDIWGLRPAELFTVMQSDFITNNAFHVSELQNLHDTRHCLSKVAVRSSRGNNLPANMLASVVDSFQAGLTLEGYGQESADMFTRGKGQTRDHDLSENPFFRRLSSVTGQHNATTFKAKHLASIDPNVVSSEVTTITGLNNAGMRMLATTDNAETWHDPSNRCTWMASLLANAVSALMMDMLLTNIAFTATNGNMSYNNGINGMEPMVVITGMIDLLGRNLGMSMANAFKHRFNHEIMYDASWQNSEVYDIGMTVDLLGDTVMDISLAGQPHIRYIIPSFCDSLIVPVVTYNEDLVRSNAFDINTLLAPMSTVLTGQAINHEI